MDYKEDLYWGRDIQVNDNIIIHQPTVGEIMQFKTEDPSFGKGEAAYYKMVAALTSTPADYDVQLDSIGVRYEDVDSMDFFFSLVKSTNLTQDVTQILFGDLDLISFERFQDPNDETHIIYLNKDGVRIDKPLYLLTVAILRDMHNLTENNQKWENEASRVEYMRIQKRRMSRRKNREKDKNVLLPMLSMLVCRPGYKYTREETLTLNIYFFYDQVKQIYHDAQVDHLMTGTYTGMIDVSKLNADEALNFIRKDF